MECILERDEDEEENLQIFGKVLVLHGEINGALKPLGPRIDDLAGETIERLLDVQILHRIVQIVISEP